jgi:8-oxo-dGTP pyrophosphatase MutT (NUDIX family)
VTDAEPEPATLIASASILLLRDGPDGPEVLMQQRHEEVGDFAGALTFPGGKVVPGDNSAAVRARADGGETHSDDELAYAASAVRETFEECGVLLARRAATGPLIDGDRVTTTFIDRPALDAEELALGDFLAKHDLRLALDRITPWSHWITPVIAPRRYDTWFYVAAVPDGQIADADSRETVEMIWIRPEDALELADAGHRSLYLATRLNLLELMEFDTVEGVLSHARGKDIRIAQPERVQAESGGYMMRLDADAGYGEWVVPLAVAMGQKPLSAHLSAMMPPPPQPRRPPAE